jgi:hypothetical protein
VLFRSILTKWGVLLLSMTRPKVLLQAIRIHRPELQ